MTVPEIIFEDSESGIIRVSAAVGENVMRIAKDAGIEGMVGDCGGILSCATCHGYVKGDWFDRLPPPTTDERDLLEGTVSPQSNSRLCCQIVMSTELDGLTIKLPESQF